MLRRVLAKKCLRPRVRGLRGMATGAAAAAPKGGWKLSLNPLPGFTKEQGLVDMVLGRSTMPAVPLNVPAYTLAPRAEVNPKGDVKVSRLRNGVKVATRDFQAPVASIGVYVNTGARDETSENAGISHFLETAAFASTRTRTEFRLIRDTSRLGASLSVNAGREFIAYTGEVLANWTRPVLETLGDLVKRPAFIDFELRDLVNHYREEAEHREHNHQLNLMEHVHGAAYGYSTLGSPLYAPLSNLAQFKKPEVLKSFVADNFTADRVSVVAVGVPHEYALELAEQEFAELEAGNKKRAASQYVGGDVRMHASPAVHTPHDQKNTHIALAWQGESWNSPDVTAMGVLSAVLGSDKLLGSQAPAGTRAVQTRLNARILASGLASSASAFATPYSDSGLFGVYAVGKPSDATALASALLAEASALAQAVSAEELHRAKLALKHSIVHSLDSRNAMLNLIGAQLASGTDGAVTTPQQWAAAVDGVTAADLQRVAQKLLKTPLTVAASGDLSKLPRYDQLTAQLK